MVAPQRSERFLKRYKLEKKTARRREERALHSHFVENGASRRRAPILHTFQLPAPMEATAHRTWASAYTQTAAQAKDKVQRRLLLDVVVAEGATVLQLLARKDQPLLVRRDALLVLDLCLDVIDGVGRLHVKRDRLAS